MNSFHQYKIAIVDVDAKTGGVRTFVDNFVRALKTYTNHKIDLINFRRIGISELKQYDIIHFSGIFTSLFWKYFFIPKGVKRILTVHGYIKDERIESFLKEKNIFKKFKILISLLIWRFFLKISYFDVITTPSETTKRINNFKKANVITNAIFLDDYINVNSIKLLNNSINFITYSSIGSRKNQIKDLIDIITNLNKKGFSSTLYIFGVNPENININKLPSFIKYMGQVKRKLFLSYLKRSDIFITLKKFPDLGYVETEAGAMKVPVIKLWNNQYEELNDGITGIVANDKVDILEKLIEFIKNYPKSKKKLGKNYYEFIKKSKNWEMVIRKWNSIFDSLS